MPEKRVVLSNCGGIDPGDISTYLARNGFEALTKARDKMTPEEIVAEVQAAALRGRGGAGFSCGLKWALARKAEGKDKVLICNADEGEVGTFKDRYLLEQDPFGLLEGLAIAAHAIGAQRAYIYLRGEYRFLLGALRSAIDQVKERGFLDNLDLEVRVGAGAYICGEESALMNSIEGRRGEARYRPPYPPVSGLFRNPTIINNVETLMNVPPIVLNGAEWFKSMGTQHSHGTKVFSVSGDVQRPGIYELVLGSKLKEVLDLAAAADVKFVQVGGATGRVLTNSMLDTPLSYETVLGSGGITVLDQSRDVIDFVRRTMEFLGEESCGKCTPCREGTEVMVNILGNLAEGNGAHGDIEMLEELSNVMAAASLCGLGQAAPVPVLDTLEYYRKEYETRIQQAVLIRSLKSLRK